MDIDAADHITAVRGGARASPRTSFATNRFHALQTITAGTRRAESSRERRRGADRSGRTVSDVSRATARPGLSGLRNLTHDVLALLEQDGRFVRAKQKISPKRESCRNVPARNR